MAVENPVKIASQLLEVLRGDLPMLVVLDNYARGLHTGPYIPENADAEYKLLAERSVTNWMPLLIRTPAQAMYVDGFKLARNDTSGDTSGNWAWDHWQRSRLDGRQGALYEGAFTYGHGFAVAEMDEKSGKSKTRLLSSLSTAALFEDPVNDLAPYAALNIRRWPTTDTNSKITPGWGHMWDDSDRYLVEFDLQPIEKRRVRITRMGKHGTSECPVTRFAAALDTEGRTVGVVEPMIPVQDRINQTVFDLLMVQTNGSFNIRWATGMAPPLKKRVLYLTDSSGNVVLDERTGKPIVEDIVDELDENGRPIPEDVQLSTKRFLFAEDAESKFGTLEGTPLEGYINSIDMSVRHLAMLSQTPPTHMMGSIVNLSAEAMAAAEVALTRKIQSYKTNFGEAWERHMNVAHELDGITDPIDEHMETMWRDMEGQSFARTADALLKLKEVGVPKEGLWDRIPGVTQTERERWAEMVRNDPAQVLASAVQRGQSATPPSQFSNADPDLE